MKPYRGRGKGAEGRRFAQAGRRLAFVFVTVALAWLAPAVAVVDADMLTLARRNAAGANHASDATYSVADNRIVSVGTAELRRQRISHA